MNGVDSAPEGWMEGLKKCSGWDKFYETAVKMTESVIAKYKEAEKRVNGISQLL